MISTPESHLSTIIVQALDVIFIHTMCIRLKFTNDAELNSEGILVEILPTWLPVLMCMVVDHMTSLYYLF